MDQTDESVDAPVLRMSRTLKAPLAQVFSAWIDAEQVRLWFAPQGWGQTLDRLQALLAASAR